MHMPSLKGDGQIQNDIDSDLQEEEPETNSLVSNNGHFLIPDPQYKDISLIRKLAFIFLIIMTQLLTQAFLSQSIIPYHYLARTFDILDNPGEVSWMSAAFSLTVGTFILIAGRFGDLLGYKNLYLFSYANLSIWSILCGIASYSHSIEFFDLCRGMQGLSFAISTPNSIALIGHYFPDGKTKIYSFSMFAAVAPAGMFIGSLWDSIFVLKSTWQWMFYISGIVSILILISAYFIIPNNIGTKYNKLTIDMFDPIGSILGVPGLILINFAFNQGPVVGWEKPYVYILLIIGVLLMILFIISEKIVKFPLIPPLNINIILTLITISAGWSSFGIWFFYLTRFSLDILNQSPIVVSIQLLPTMLSGLIASLSTGFLITKIPASLIILFAMVCFLIGSVLNAFKTVGQVYWRQRFLSLLITPFAMDTSFPAGTILLSKSLPREHQGVAGSLIATVVNYSIAIGLGIAGTVEYYTTKHGATELQGIRNAMYTGIGLSGFSIIIALFFNLYVFFCWRKTKKLEKTNLNSTV
jgi:MFS family permease